MQSIDSTMADKSSIFDSNKNAIIAAKLNQFSLTPFSVWIQRFQQQSQTLPPQQPQSRLQRLQSQQSLKQTQRISSSAMLMINKILVESTGKQQYPRTSFPSSSFASSFASTSRSAASTSFALSFYLISIMSLCISKIANIVVFCAFRLAMKQQRNKNKFVRLPSIDVSARSFSASKFLFFSLFAITIISVFGETAAAGATTTTSAAAVAANAAMMTSGQNEAKYSSAKLLPLQKSLQMFWQAQRQHLQPQPQQHQLTIEDIESAAKAAAAAAAALLRSDAQRTSRSTIIFRGDADDDDDDEEREAEKQRNILGNHNHYRYSHDNRQNQNYNNREKSGNSIFFAKTESKNNNDNNNYNNLSNDINNNEDFDKIENIDFQKHKAGKEEKAEEAKTEVEYVDLEKGKKEEEAAAEEEQKDEEEAAKNEELALPKCEDQAAVCGYAQINSFGISRVPLCRCSGRGAQCPRWWNAFNTVMHGNDFYQYCKRKPRALAACKLDQIAYTNYAEADLASGRKLRDIHRVHCLCARDRILSTFGEPYFNITDTTYVYETRQICRKPPRCVRKQTCLSITETAKSTLEKRHCRCSAGKFCPHDIRLAFDSLQSENGVVYHMRCV